MIVKKISTILIWSADFRKLADWYQSVFSLEVEEELDHPNDTGVLFKFPEGGPWLWIGQHSGIKGKSKEPFRHMFNISVDSVTEAYTELIAKGVKFEAKPFLAPTMPKYFATFYDGDGNVGQLIGQK